MAVFTKAITFASIRAEARKHGWQDPLGDLPEDEVCLFCGGPIKEGQDALLWSGRGGELTAHALCVYKSAPDLLSDIADCARVARQRLAQSRKHKTP